MPAWGSWLGLDGVLGVVGVAGEDGVEETVDDPDPVPAETVEVPVEPVAPVEPVVEVAPEAAGVVDAVVLVVAVVAMCCGVNGSRPRPGSLEAPCAVSTVIAGSADPVEYGRLVLGCGVTRLVGAFLESSSGTATRATISRMAIGHSLRSRSSLIMLVRMLIGWAG